MSHQITKRIATIVGTIALVATLASVGGMASAGPAHLGSLTAGHAVHPNTKSVPIGTDNFYFTSGSGFVRSGTMTISADGAWSMSDFTDIGFWAASSKDIFLSDSGKAIWVAALGKHGLASAKKPGTITFQGDSTPSYTFYSLD